MMIVAVRMRNQKHRHPTSLHRIFHLALHNIGTAHCAARLPHFLGVFHLCSIVRLFLPSFLPSLLPRLQACPRTSCTRSARSSRTCATAWRTSAASSSSARTPVRTVASCLSACLLTCLLTYLLLACLPPCLLACVQWFSLVFRSNAFDACLKDSYACVCTHVLRAPFFAH